MRVLDRNDDVGLLFTDISMPGEMDGLGLIAQVRQQRPQIRCIAASGRVNLDPAMLAEGMKFLPKPYTAFSLTEAINRQAGSAGSRRAFRERRDAA
jgi:DNA-binding NtrC family response regulator